MEYELSLPEGASPEWHGARQKIESINRQEIWNLPGAFIPDELNGRPLQVEGRPLEDFIVTAGPDPDNPALDKAAPQVRELLSSDLRRFQDYFDSGARLNFEGDTEELVGDEMIVCVLRLMELTDVLASAGFQLRYPHK